MCKEIVLLMAVTRSWNTTHNQMHWIRLEKEANENHLLKSDIVLKSMGKISKTLLGNI